MQDEKKTSNFFGKRKKKINLKYEEKNFSVFYNSEYESDSRMKNPPFSIVHQEKPGETFSESSFFCSR
jgi:hypothetical protein